MKPRNICVLGGTGFVGSHVVARLARDGHRVRVLSRRPDRHRELRVLPRLELIEADVHDEGMLRKYFLGQDVVINLVGILNERGRKGQGFRRAHVELPQKVVAACRGSGVRRLLHMSALNADARQGPSHYLKTKGEGEALVHAAEGLDVTSFRPSVIFGPGDSFFNRFAKLLRRMPLVFPLACADARFAPVYVLDVAEAFAIAVDNRATIGQCYDLCGPRSYTLRELVTYTAQVSGLRRRVIPLGDTLSRLQATLLEFAPGKPFTRDNYLSMQRDSVCAGPFPQVFGIKPTALEAIVPQYLAHGRHRDRLAGLRRHRG